MAGARPRAGRGVNRAPGPSPGAATKRGTRPVATSPGARRVVILKDGNRIAVDPTTPRVHDLLRPHLHYVGKRFLFGYEKKAAQLAGRAPVELTPTDVYTLDHRGRLVTAAGFHRRVRSVLRRSGYEVGFKDLRPHPRPEVYEPDWARLEGLELRHRQDEVLAKMVTHPGGRIDCPTGYGKSLLIGMLAKACYKARFVITTARIPVLKDRIYPELCGFLPGASVGIRCSKKTRNAGARVLCCSAGTLHHARADADFVVADEVHELGAESFAPALARFERARMFGLSASHDMRHDGRDLELEGFFGPVIMRVTPQEATEHGMIVQRVVVWRDVFMGVNPCDGLEDTEKARAGIWANDYRNGLVAEDAVSYPDDTQVLVTVATLEHAVNLKRLLPGFAMVYRPDDRNAEEVARYKRRRELDRSEPEMTDGRFDKLREAFEKGRLNKAIATTVWNVGVDFRKLSVLVRADAAGGGGASNIQIPGRPARLYAGKTCAVIRDYRDQFDRGYRQRAAGRERDYAAQGFVQHFPEPPERGSLHYYLFRE